MSKQNIIYFDNAASAKPHPAAIDAFNAVVTNDYANPSALHKGGIEAEKVIKASKEQILSRLKLPKGNLIFTSGATESNNLAILNSVVSRRKNIFMTTEIEHPSVSATFGTLPYEVAFVLPFDLTEEVNNDVAFVSMTAVCGETGFITDAPKCCREIKEQYPDCIVHVDGSQGFGKVPLAGDLISLSAHKIGGIAGVGALYIKDGVHVKPMIHGGGQQNKLRSGTEPVALIAAFGEAATHTFDAQPLQNKLVAELARLGLTVHSRNNVPHIVNFSCGVKSEVMLHFLAEHGIYVSSGSACARGKRSAILPIYGVSDKDVDTAIRVSFGWQNTLREIDTFIEVLEMGIKRWK
ncbi:MAG: aminotransferase class V-fold PLP-dependent enzyme [Oscillospiraceae bacterium]|nr:aminotransferase class V-fold PLP-dependent enzyme [Oscillospiraceae bacterium]